MENRFSAKDFVLVALLLGLIGIVALAMFQFDRQWETLKRLESQVVQQNATQVEQGRQLDGIQKTLRVGVTFNAAGGPTTNNAATMPSERFASEKGEPFATQLAAMARPDYAQGDWLIQNFGVKVSQLTPLLSSDTYASIVQNRVLEPFAYRDPETLEWRPMLATDWSVSADGLVVDVRLRRGVKFSDGAPMTADDVTFAIDWIRNPEVNAPRARAGYEPLDHVEKVNDFEVKFVFKKPALRGAAGRAEFRADA